MSSAMPTAVISAAAPRMPRISRAGGQEQRARDEHADEDRQAAEQRGLRLGEPALLHRIDRADPHREPRDQRRDGRRQRQGDQKGEQRAFFHG